MSVASMKDEISSPTEVMALTCSVMGTHVANRLLGDPFLSQFAPRLNKDIMDQFGIASSNDLGPAIDKDITILPRMQAAAMTASKEARDAAVKEMNDMLTESEGLMEWIKARRGWLLSDEARRNANVQSQRSVLEMNQELLDSGMLSETERKNLETECARIRNVLTAYDGESGLEIARSEKPGLIFLDIVLPGVDGFNVLRTLRRDPATKDVPIIMMSGNAQATEQFYVQRIGADDFMKKPFSRAEVFNRIERVLDENGIPRHATRPGTRAEAASQGRG